MALNKAIDTLTADIGQKRDEFTKKQEDIATLQSCVSDQKARNDALNDQVNGLSHELDGLKAEKENLKHAMKTDFETETQSYESKVQQYKQEIEALKSAKSNVEKEMIQKSQKMKQEMDASNDGHKKQMDDLQRRFENEKKQMMEQTQQVDLLRADIEQKNEDLTKNQDEISTLQSCVTEQAKRNDALRADIEQKNEDLTKNQDEIRTLQSSVTERTKRNDVLSEQVNGLTDELRRRRQEWTQEIYRLKVQLDEKQTQIESNWMTKMVNYNRSNVENQSLIKEYQQKMKEMDSRLDEINKNHTNAIAMKEREWDTQRRNGVDEMMKLKQELFNTQCAAKEKELKWERETWHKEQQQTKEQDELMAVKRVLEQLKTSAARDKEETDDLREQLEREEQRLNALVLEKQQEIEQQAQKKRKEQEDKLKERSAKRNVILRRQRLNTDNFKHWTHPNELLDWIMGLDDGKYEQFEGTLGAYLEKKNISGQYIYEHDITVQELRDEWGMGECADSLFARIKYLKVWSAVVGRMKRYAKSKGKRLNMKTHHPFNNTRNVLVFSVGIGEYDTDSGYGPLPDIIMDLSRYKHTFADRYGYTLISNDDYNHRNMYKSDGTQRTYYLSDTDLYELLLEVRRKLFSNHDQTQLLFDALIVTISSHGVSKGIVCSDGTILAYKEIKKIFSDSTLDRIPKIYIVDACREEVAQEVSDLDLKEAEDEDTNPHPFGMTLFADSDGKSVRGGLLSKYMMDAFEANIEGKNGFYKVVIQATNEMKRCAGGPVLRTGDDYIHGSMDDVVFVPNVSRGREKNPLNNVDDDLINILNPQKGGSTLDLCKQYYKALSDGGFKDNASLCVLTKEKLIELGVKGISSKGVASTSGGIEKLTNE
eukprot:370688_1